MGADMNGNSNDTFPIKREGLSKEQGFSWEKSLRRHVKSRKLSEDI